MLQVARVNPAEEGTSEEVEVGTGAEAEIGFSTKEPRRCLRKTVMVRMKEWLKTWLLLKKV